MHSMKKIHIYFYMVYKILSMSNGINKIYVHDCAKINFECRLDSATESSENNLG